MVAFVSDFSPTDTICFAIRKHRSHIEWKKYIAFLHVDFTSLAPFWNLFQTFFPLLLPCNRIYSWWFFVPIHCICGIIVDVCNLLYYLVWLYEMAAILLNNWIESAAYRVVASSQPVSSSIISTEIGRIHTQRKMQSQGAKNVLPVQLNNKSSVLWVCVCFEIGVRFL